MTAQQRPGTKAGARSDQVGDRIGSIIPSSTDINEQSMAAWRDRLAEHVDDPACLAGCQRLGRILGGAR